MEEGRWDSIQTFGQNNITVPCDGKKHCPSQSQFLLEALEAGALETSSQTIRGSSFRYTDRELWFRFPFEPPQCLYAYTCVLWCDREPTALWGHSHTPGINSNQYLFHLHMLCFPEEYQLFHTCTQLLCRNFVLRMSWLFFRVIFNRFNAFWTADWQQLNSLAISVWYASGCSATYALSLSGSIFLLPRTGTFGFKSPFSFNCFSHFRIVETATLKVLLVSSNVCPSSRYSIVRSLYFTG